VRAMAGSEAQSLQVEPDLTEARVEFEGQAWRVTLLGRAGGAAAGAAPLLLLGFGPAESSEGSPTHEALIVGRTLSAVSESSLKQALASASPVSAEEVGGQVGGTEDGPS